MQPNSLESLPVRTIKAHKVGGGWVDVLVDGDYDGEFFSTLLLREISTGMIALDRISLKTLDINPKSRFYLQYLVLPPKKGHWVRFKNRNYKDCRSANLEYVTPKESAKLRLRPHFKTRRNNKTGYRGVHRYEGFVGWSSESEFYALLRGEYLGRYRTAEQAARAYDKAAKDEYGDRALLNFPDGTKEERA